MKWKILFGLLFILFIILSIFYSSRSLIVYQKTANEKIQETPTIYHYREVTRTYEDNYASIGGAIAFGIVAAGSIIAFAIILKNENA